MDDPLTPAPLVRVVPGQQPGRDGMEPVQRAGGPHAGFVEARHKSGGGPLADEPEHMTGQMRDLDPTFLRMIWGRISTYDSAEIVGEAG